MTQVLRNHDDDKLKETFINELSMPNEFTKNTLFLEYLNWRNFSPYFFKKRYSNRWWRTFGNKIDVHGHSILFRFGPSFSNEKSITSSMEGTFDLTWRNGIIATIESGQKIWSRTSWDQGGHPYRF